MKMRLVRIETRADENGRETIIRIWKIDYDFCDDSHYDLMIETPTRIYEHFDLDLPKLNRDLVRRGFQPYFED